MMENKISPNKPSNFFTRIFVSLFFLVIWLPLMQMNFTVIPEVGTNENRTLAEKPRIRKLIDLQTYAIKYDRYFNDHYGFRSSLVRMASLLHLTVFNTLPTGRVIAGDQGWLWYNDPRDGISLKDYYGSANFTEEELERIKERIIRIDKKLKKDNIHFLLVVVPNKHTIYPEYLPADVRQARGRKTRLDQVIQALNNSGVDFIDLRTSLLAEKKRTTYLLYSRTDTHWNDLGAFFGYKQIMLHLRRRYPEIKQLGINKFSVHAEENGGTGDLAGLLHMTGLLNDISITLTPKLKLSATMVPADRATRAGDAYIGFQNSNRDLPTMVMFRDSFANSLIPFLSEGFSKSIYIKWTLNNIIDFSDIAREKPKIVILEIVERWMGIFLEI